MQVQVSLDAQDGSTRALQLQRARIVDAMALLVGELGFGGVSVACVCARAGISRGTFRRAFGSLRDCLLAVIDDGYRRADELLERAFQRDGDWLDGVREALCSLLLLFDDEPVLARVWFVETLAAGSWALERRERHVTALTAKIVQRWPLPPAVEVSPLAATGVMESVLGIIHTRLLTSPREPLIGLLPALMSFIAALYLNTQHAMGELKRCEALAAAILAERRARGDSAERVLDAQAAGLGVTLPSALRDPRAHRARHSLLYLVRHPGASNRQIAEAVGVKRHEQMSKLLSKLESIGVIACDRTRRAGHANAWSLTDQGRCVAGALGAQFANGSLIQSGAFCQAQKPATAALASGQVYR